MCRQESNQEGPHRQHGLGLTPASVCLELLQKSPRIRGKSTQSTTLEATARKSQNSCIILPSQGSLASFHNEHKSE